MSDCKFLSDNLVDFTERRLDPDSMEKLTRHIASCSDCRKLAERFASIWLSADEPEGIVPSTGFWATLQDRLDVLDDQRGTRQILMRLLPVLQPSAAIAALLIAVVLGYNFGRVPVQSSTTESSEIADLWSDYGLESFDQFPDGSLADIYFEVAGNGGGES